jgi:hypothetical protein
MTAVDHSAAPPIPDSVPGDVVIKKPARRLRVWLRSSRTAQDPPKPPAFATGTELVLVDFVDSDSGWCERPVGQRLRGEEDGKERPIRTFEAFAGDDPSTATARRGAPEPAPGAALAAGIHRRPRRRRSAVATTVGLAAPAIKALLAAVAEPSAR